MYVYVCMYNASSTNKCVLCKARLWKFITLLCFTLILFFFLTAQVQIHSVSVFFNFFFHPSTYIQKLRNVYQNFFPSLEKINKRGGICIFFFYERCGIFCKDLCVARVFYDRKKIIRTIISHEWPKKLFTDVSRKIK